MGNAPDRDLPAADAQQLAVLQAVYNSASVAICITDEARCFVLVNDAFCRIFGYRRTDLMGQPFTRLLPDAMREMAAERHDDYLAGSGESVGEMRVLDGSGDVRKVMLTAARVTTPDNRRFKVTTIQDIGAFRVGQSPVDEMPQVVDHLSYRDSLTGLPNGRLVDERLKFRINSAKQTGLHSALLFIDFDNFKTIRDTMGPRIGDALLIEAADRLQGELYESDMVARLGADQFMVVLADLSDKSLMAARIAESAAEKVLQILSKPSQRKELGYLLTVSIGLVVFSGEGQTADELVHRAGIAMHQAKLSGKNSYAFFDPEVQARLLDRHRTELELREALRARQFIPFYQGLVNEAGELVGAELLIRWQHPRRGLIGPADFIPTAEDSGLIVELGYMVMEMAVSQLESWQAEGIALPLSISINISARHFEHPDFENRIAELLAGRAFDRSLLKLEVTESALAKDMEKLALTMDTLQSMGLSFALDDFGTGYSSLAYLKRLPIGQLKIDQSFVRDIVVDQNDRSITETIIALARALDIGVVAEGVETEAQRDLLLELGCKVFQGYLFGRPEPVEKFYRRYGLGDGATAVSKRRLAR